MADLMTQIREYLPLAVFAVLTAITLGGAIKVISTRSIIHAAFWLFPVFAGIAGLYLMLDAQFLAAIQVLIYIGAILVLIIFAVTLTRNAADTVERQTNRYAIPVVLSAVVLMVAVGAACFITAWPPAQGSIDGRYLLPGVPVTDVAAIGVVLLQDYLLPFEIASVLLLAAMVGAIVLARKEKPSDPGLTCADESVAVSESREPAGV